MKKFIAGGERANQPVLLADVPVPEAPASGRKPRAIHVDGLPAADTDKRCLNAAIRFLKNRPRSEYEVRARLRHHGYDSPSIDAAIANLKAKGLIDDLAFARFWVDNRDTFKPRGQRLIKAELRQKGVTVDTIGQLEIASDDEEGVYRAARQKARSIPTADYRLFQRRLGDYLKRRGFGYTVIKKVVEEVWSERTNTVT